jgi:hypothetical protein
MKTDPHDVKRNHRVMRDGALKRVREICLALPETTEKEAWGVPTFRVRERIFAQYEIDLHGEERVALWCKAPAGAQDVLVASNPVRFFRPPYVGPSGWIGIRLDVDVDWDELAALVEESYRMTAPMRLAASLDGGAFGGSAQESSR